MKPELKKYFQFSRRERNGVFILLFVLVGLILAKFTVPFWAEVNETEAQQQFEENSKRLQQLAQNGDDEAVPTSKLKPFNPNTISLDSMLAMGINQKLANQIINYRTKVGAFATKADVAKLYNLSDSIYVVLEPYLLLPASTPVQQKSTALKGKLEINSADSLQLLQVRGIGPVIAHLILDYRKKLGGYFSLEQLGEAFYINANTLAEKQQRMDEIKRQLTVNPSRIKKLQINKLTQKELSYHPYISYKQSKAIIQYRKKNGIIQSFEQLKLVPGITERDLQLLQLYIAF